MFLSKREIRTIKALAEIMIPQEGAFPYGFRDVDIISFFEEFLSRVPLRVKWFLFFNLWIFEYFSWISLLYCTYDDFEKDEIKNGPLSQSKNSLVKNLVFWAKTPDIFSRMRSDHREKIILKMRGNRYFAIRGIYLLTSIVLLLSFYSNQQVMDKIAYYGYKEGVNRTA